MGNLIDYIKWRGDITFEERDLSVLDNMVFCLLSYYDFKEMLAKGRSISLNEAVSHLSSDDIRINLVSGTGEMENYILFLGAAAESGRFGDVLLSDYVDTYDEERNIQFSAITFHISDRKHFIAYRGTDDTIIGWKEDFMLSFTETEAQMEALKYAKDVMESYEGDFYIGGHSKGGNLAMYAAAKLEDDELGKIRHIYVNDGPGLSKTVLDRNVIDRIDSRTTFIKPEACIVGRLFECEFKDTRIIGSDAEGMMQHNLINWTIERGGLVIRENHTPESDWIASAFDIWLEDVPNENRQIFVDSLFDAMMEGGAVTLQDITDRGAGELEQILLRLMSADPVAKKLAASLPEAAVFGTVAKSVKQSGRLQGVLESPLWQGIVLGILGILFLLLPENMMIIIFLVVSFGLVVAVSGRTLVHLKRTKWNLHQNRPMILLSIVLVVIYVLMIFKQHALELFSSIFFGILFLLAAYNAGETLKEGYFESREKWVKARCVIELVLGFILAFFNFVAPEGTVLWYAVSLGIILVADGLSRIIQGAVRLHGQRS